MTAPMTPQQEAEARRLQALYSLCDQAGCCCYRCILAAALSTIDELRATVVWLRERLPTEVTLHGEG